MVIAKYVHMFYNIIMYLSYHDNVTPKGRMNTSYAMPSKALYREMSQEWLDVS